MTANTLRLKSIEIKGMKKIANVEIEAVDQHYNIISGENGAGKSTFMEALRYALLGKAYYGKGTDATNIINKDSEKLEIKVVLQSEDRERTITIRRKLTKGGTSSYKALEVVAGEADELTQKDLTDMIKQHSIDPVAFSRMNAKDQVNEIKLILGIDTDMIDAKIAVQTDEVKGHRAVNDSKKKTLAEVGTPEKVSRVDTAELSKQLQEATEYKNKKESSERNVELHKKDVAEIEKKIAELKSALKEEKEELKKAEASHAENYSAEVVDTTEIQTQIENAAEVNADAAKWERYTELKQSASDAEVKYTKEHTRLKELRDERQKLIIGANLPVEGMGLSETDGVMIDGIPFAQKSSGEKLLLASKIMSGMNPQVKIIYIKDGSLLDNKNSQLLKDFAINSGFQFFVEEVGEKANTIILRDGEVVAE